MQSLHLIMPTSSSRGSAPNVFMSRAESHAVGGDGSSFDALCAGGVCGETSHENGEAGGEELGLSLRAIVVVG